MDSKIRKLVVDYSNAKNALLISLQSDISQPTRTLEDLKKEKEYKAVQLADFILQHLEETIHCLEAEKTSQ